MFRIAVDIGGTFTDVVAESGDRSTSIKVLTSSNEPEMAALDGIERLLRELNCSHADVSGIVHGTTLATNALIERRGAKTAFITTSGFRDVLEMRYERRFEQYALDIEMPEPLVPRSLRFGLSERILADGLILKSPSDQEIEKLAGKLREQQVEAIAIGFLHSYKHPQHEQYVAERLRPQIGNDVTICLSSEVAGEIREYERFSSACANAYVRPLISKYLGRLASRLQDRGFVGSFLMMLSDGALTTLDQAIRFPIRLVEGGPAGGVALAASIAREINSDKALSLDIGGTTAKICFIESGQPKTSRRFEVARAWRDIKGSGLPIKVPTVELVEVGAGGGSIASVDNLGRLKVGPKSAGSHPGPAAYNQGGTDATITDAHLTVGNISPEGFAGGIIELAAWRAPEAISAHIKDQLGVDKVQAAAAGIIELADETMANAARVHGIEQGLDITRFDLLVSGGGGGLHAARIAEKLGIQRVIVPQSAGVGSAVGFLCSPVAYESAISIVETLCNLEIEALTDRIGDTLAQVLAVVAKAVSRERIEQTIKAELRYQGQGFELTLPMTDDKSIAENLGTLTQRFEDRYRELFGFILPDIPIELVSISVTAKEVPSGIASHPVSRDSRQAPKRERKVFDLAAKRDLCYQVIERSSMNGGVLDGPVVVSEAQTTTLVRPGWSVRRLDNGHLVMERNIT